MNSRSFLLLLLLAGLLGAAFGHSSSSQAKTLRSRDNWNCKHRFWDCSPGRNANCCPGLECKDHSCVIDKGATITCRHRRMKCNENGPCCPGLFCQDGVCDTKKICRKWDADCDGDSCCPGLLCDNHKCKKDPNAACLDKDDKCIVLEGSPRCCPGLDCVNGRQRCEQPKYCRKEGWDCSTREDCCENLKCANHKCAQDR